MDEFVNGDCGLYGMDKSSTVVQSTEFGAANDAETITGLIRTFDLLSPKDQTYLVQAFLTRMSHNQHNDVEGFLRAMLRRDFVRSLNSLGLSNLSQYILSFMDARTLNEAEQCSSVWKSTIQRGQLWRRLLQRKVREDNRWLVLAKRRKWLPLVKPSERSSSMWNALPDSLYKQLYGDVVADLKSLHTNWRTGTYTLKKIYCNSQNSKGVYCLQYDDEKIVSGLRDNTIKVWNRKDYTVSKILVGHTGSVLCLQYEGDLVITGSSDTTIRVWSLESEKMLSVLVHHSEAVLHLRFVDKIMVTSSKDRTIAVWDINSPTDISLKRVLVGHRAAVNVVDFDSRYIVSASGDRTIKVWSTEKCEFHRTLTGHKRGIACLQYREDLIVSGSSDNTIRIWNALTGCCIRTLEGHQELVRCIRFNDQFIVSGAYDGKIKVWDLKAALDPRPPTADICIRTLSHHTGRVFRLQFDEFQIVSSSHDDTILVWDFLTPMDGESNGIDNNGTRQRAQACRPHPLSPQVRSALNALANTESEDIAMDG